MTNSASFRSLFQQSRYGRAGGGAGIDPQTDRRELFAVAAVAFAIKHSPRFADHFLRRICRISDSVDLGAIELALQPHHHTDLAIKDRKQNRLFVCEFKFHSSLKPKQNPEFPTDFSASAQGYGQLISKEPQYANFSEKYYIVVQKIRGFDPITVSGLHCHSVAWKEFDVKRGSMESFIDDMLDSLGDMGIPSLRFRNLNNMKRSDHAAAAVDMHQICEAVAADLGIKSRQVDWDISRDSNASWYGINLPLGLSGFKNIDRECKGQSGNIGWFGYQTPINGKPELAVWFYAGSEAAASSTFAFVKELLRDKKSLRVSSPVDSNFSLAVDGDSVQDDRHWFEEIVEALKR